MKIGVSLNNLDFIQKDCKLNKNLSYSYFIELFTIYHNNIMKFINNYCKEMKITKNHEDYFDDLESFLLMYTNSDMQSHWEAEIGFYQNIDWQYFNIDPLDIFDIWLNMYSEILDEYFIKLKKEFE